MQKKIADKDRNRKCVCLHARRMHAVYAHLAKHFCTLCDCPDFEVEPICPKEACNHGKSIHDAVTGKCRNQRCGCTWKEAA